MYIRRNLDREDVNVSEDGPTAAVTPERPRWRGRLKRWAIRLGIVVAILALVEGYFRYVHSPSEGLTRFVFLHEMSRERWDYLEEHRDELLLDSERKEKPGVRHANHEYTEEPEGDRPPWDRVAHAYHVKTNGHGFRDVPFVADKAPSRTRILVLGDSLAFGKGQPVEARFTDILRGRAPEHVEILNLADLGCGIECMVQILDEYLAFAPDLVLVQPSGNDLDQSMWRMAMKHEPGFLAHRIRSLMRSRAVQALAYGLWGDAQLSQVDQALDDAAEFYAPALDHLFQLGRDHGFALAVVSFPAANGTWYGRHVVGACAAAGEVCLGTVALDVEHPERWVKEWSDAPEVQDALERPWLVDTADLMDLDVESLASIFPFLEFYSDLVHPNRAAHRVMAGQLESFLQAKWPLWTQPAE